MHPQRVLLISPSSDRFYVPTAPLGLAYIAGGLPMETEVYGLDLNVLKWVHGLTDDGLLGTIANYLDKSERFGTLPHIIGLTVYQETLEQAISIAKLASTFGIPVVAGGIYPTLFPDRIPFVFDYLVRGDGEETFCKLLKALDGSDGDPVECLSGIAGLSYPSKEAKTSISWCHVGQPQRMENRPLPRREIFDRFNMGFRYFSGRVISSSGCPYACSFCVNSEYARRAWRGRSVSEVVEEVRLLIRDPAISEIAFSDDQFLGCTAKDYQRAYRILCALEPITQTRSLRINLQVRADHFLQALEEIPDLESVLRRINQNFNDPNPAVSRELHGRPVRGISLDVGVESNLPRRLQQFGKGLSVDTNRLAVKKAREMGLDLGVYMILFTPDLTLEELREEFIIYCREYLETDALSPVGFFGLFNELIPYRGTRAYRELKERGELVESGNEVGFRFHDPRVAAFYIHYLHMLNSQGFAGKSRFELVEIVFRMIERSEEFKEDHGKLASQVICEMKKMDEVERIYQKMVEYS